jgi:hypothetical protein
MVTDNIIAETPSIIPMVASLVTGREEVSPFKELLSMRCAK